MLLSDKLLDGTYAKYDPNPPQWWLCLRCADYRQAGGTWRLQFDRGVMRIYYEVTGWHSLASYTVSGGRLYLFNDPYCKDATGEYTWKVTDGNLTLETIDDTCSFQLRGKNLSEQSWAACQVGAAAAGEAPRGCTDPMVESITTPILPAELTVNVYQADVRLTAPSSDLYVNASGTDHPTSEDVCFSYSDESLLYGTNRVLWTDNDWIEVVTDAPFTSIGVQFRGDYVIGWARVLFDAEEVWRGDTSKIWSAEKIHGGYIEVTIGRTYLACGAAQCGQPSGCSGIFRFQPLNLRTEKWSRLETRGINISIVFVLHFISEPLF